VPLPEGLPPPVVLVVETAIGRAHRRDPVTGSTGGPAGNARLTAWLGLALLVLFVAELVTLLDVSGLITWHVVLGALLIPPSLAKTASTGWRIFRYYAGSADYVQAGPPPLLLRALGPLVVLGTLGVLATGVVVGLLGQDRGRQSLVHIVGNDVSALTLHQAAFIVWAVVTGLHVLARLLPAVLLVGAPERSVPGESSRAAVLVATAVAAGVLAPVLLAASSSWQSDDRTQRFNHDRADVHAHH
jgi:hypothetical protein